MTSCPVCFCSVSEENLDDHLIWHRTLRNTPPKETP